jgi:hypothetical protein
MRSAGGGGPVCCPGSVKVVPCVFLNVYSHVTSMLSSSGWRWGWWCDDGRWRPKHSSAEGFLLLVILYNALPSVNNWKLPILGIVRHFIIKSFRPCTICITRLDLVSPWVIVKVEQFIVGHFIYNIIKSNTLDLRHESRKSGRPPTALKYPTTPAYTAKDLLNYTWEVRIDKFWGLRSICNV